MSYLNVEDEREAKRRWARKARLNPVYRAKERARSLRYKQRQKLKRILGVIETKPRCFNCGKPAITEVERMVERSGGMVNQNVPYCGKC